MKNYLEPKKIQESILRHIQEQVREHSFGKLVFLASVGPRAWGFAPDNVNYNYQGIYISKEDNTYNVFISKDKPNYSREIILISFERIIGSVLHSDISSLIFINSPAIYASKDFLKFRKWVNSNLSKQAYLVCQIKQIYAGRKNYLYDFFFTGNGIAILEQKKVIANLSELNKKILKIPAIDKIIEEEKARLPFENEKECKEIQKKLKARLEKANKKSRLPKVVDPKKLFKLKIVKKINPYFWYWPEGGPISRKKEREK